MAAFATFLWEIMELTRGACCTCYQDVVKLQADRGGGGGGHGAGMGLDGVAVR